MQLLASSFWAQQASTAEKAHKAWEEKHEIVKKPTKIKQVTKLDLPGLPRPVKMTSWMHKSRDEKHVLPSCEFRKDQGGYYNTCLT